MAVPVLTEQSVRSLITPREALAAVRRAFTRLALGRATVPQPVGFEVGSRRGEVHIKAAHLDEDPFYVVKIASGFYTNAERGLPISNGLMIAFDAATGQVRAVLLDNGYLTELRTAAAGALAADLLANRLVRRVGIIGCGTQARFQLEALLQVRRFAEVVVFGRAPQKAADYAREMATRCGLDVRVAAEARQAVEGADIVVTATSARAPIVRSSWLHPGMHLTAVGADAPGKQELEADVLRRADKIVVDHREQCLRLGELQHAQAAGLPLERIHAELGELAAGIKPGRAATEEITIADLTGVGVQDAAVASVVVQKAGGLSLC